MQLKSCMCVQGARMAKCQDVRDAWTHENGHACAAWENLYVSFFVGVPQARCGPRAPDVHGHCAVATQMLRWPNDRSRAHATPCERVCDMGQCKAHPHSSADGVGGSDSCAYALCMRRTNKLRSRPQTAVETTDCGRDHKQHAAWPA